MRIRGELDQDVYVAIGAEVRTQNGAKQCQAGNLVFLAKPDQFLIIHSYAFHFVPLHGTTPPQEA